jgi:protease I
MTLLSDINVAIFADHGVSQTELAVSRESLERAGVKVFIISAQPIEVKAWHHENWGNRIKIDMTFGEVSPEKFHGVIVPGGPLHADRLRHSEEAVDLIRQFFSAGRNIGAIGHGVQVLISAEILKGRQVTGLSSLKTDLANAGAICEDDEGIVSDNGLITCRSEREIEKFCKIFLEKLRQGINQRTETII